MTRKVIHIITGLGDGGAEGVLFRLCKNDRVNFHHVISLTDAGKYGPMLLKIGVSLTTLNISSSWTAPLAFISLVRLLLRENPAVVQTWMYHGDLLGGLAARIAGIKTVVWGIRHTTLESGKSKTTTIWIAKLLAKLSFWLPAKIVVCALRAMDVHESLGYDRSKMRYIPNGYDLFDFRPMIEPQSELKASLVSARSIPFIGMVGRFNQQKDHVNLLDALVILRQRGLEFMCVLVGKGLDSGNPQIVEWITRRGLEHHVHLLGRRSDIPEIMNTLDLHMLSSAYGEAFPNVIAEAMACGTPCVVTDVGDAACIVGDTGWVVEPRDPKKLAQAIAEAFREKNNDPSSWYKRRQKCRDRIQNNFDIKAMVKSYQEVWSTL